MKIQEIISLALDKKIDYSTAMEHLKKLKLPEELEEEYENILYKILGNKEKMNHHISFFLECIPNELYFEILNNCINMVRDNLYTPDIINELFYKYQLGPELLNYFINESISIVRMNNMTPEEIASIGEAYHTIASQLEAKGIREKPIIKSQEINAEETEKIDIEMEFGEE